MSLQNYKIFDKSDSKPLSENKACVKWLWLQEAIDNEHINYQKHSTLEIVKRIGRGAMGEVYKATSSCFQKTVALKKFESSSDFTIDEIINEVIFLCIKRCRINFH